MKLLFTTVLFLLFLTDSKAQYEEFSCAQSKTLAFQNFNRRAKQLPGQELFDVIYVKLDLNATEKSNAISGNALIKSKALADLTKSILELHNLLTVDSVYFNNTKTTFSRTSNTLTINAPSTITKGSIFTVQIFYGGNPPNGGFFNGFSNAKSGAWGNNATWSLSEPDNAMHWWPCKQVLTDKIDSTDVWITLDTGLKAGSNGVLRKVTPLSPSKNRYEWKYNNKIAYYLISISVARYVDYSFNVTIPGISKPVLVQNYIYDNPATLTAFKTEIDKTGDMLKVFSKLFGPYPFADMKYGHCMAPFSGGMEHNTMTTQGTFNTTLTAHELGHQWWGDHVTCSSWKDIWVNEGFARYCEFIYLASFSSTQARSSMNAFHRSVLSSSTGSVFVKDTTNANSIFSSRLTYDKGAAIIHTLRFMFNNDTNFFRMIRDYQTTYSNKNATVIDFKNIAAKWLGSNLDVFFNQWYYGEGHPTFNISLNQEKGFCIIKVDQTVSAPGITPLFVTPLQLTMRGTKDTTFTVFINAATNRFQIPTKMPVTRVAVDTNQWVLNDTGTFSTDTSLHYILPLSAKQITKVNPLTIAPNPAASKIVVIGEILKPQSYAVYNMEGKRVLKGTIAGAHHSISIAELPAGCYVFKTGSLSIKFIKE